MNIQTLNQVRHRDQPMEQQNLTRTNITSRRSQRSNRYQILYNTESNQWLQQQDIQDAYIHDQHIQENMEMLESSARNTSTPIRPYYHPRGRLLRNERHPTESNIIISSNPWSEEESILIENREQERSYFRDLRSRQNQRRYLHQLAAEMEQSRGTIREEGSDLDEEQIASEVPSAKSIEEYKEFIPACWFEVLEKDNQISISIIESYGPLALLLYTRIMKLSRDYDEMRELRVIAVISAAQSQGRNGMDEIKFIQKILEFYNYNISLAKRDVKCKMRLQLLVNIIPSFKQLKKVFTNFPPDDNEIVVYKVVLDIMERYYIDFDGPLFLRYRTQFLPFAELFYNSLNETHIEIIRSHISYFRPYYNKFLMFENHQQFIEYYDKKRLDYDNLCRETYDSDCYM